MTRISLPHFALRFDLRQWFGRTAPAAAAPPVVTAGAAYAQAITPLPPPKPARSHTPGRARYQQPDPALGQWYAAQPHPCTIVAFINDATGKITQFHAIAAAHGRNLFTMPTAMTSNLEWEQINPHCLRSKEMDFSDLVQAPTNTPYALLQLLAANQAASAEMAALDRDISQAFIAAFYHDIPAHTISASTVPNSPAEGDLEELLARLSARNHAVWQWEGRAEAFRDGWQAMRLREIEMAAMPEQALSHAEE
jgi:hypothetical protein